MATETLLTMAQFDGLPVKEGNLYELNEGGLVTMTEPLPRHNWVRDNIAAALRDFAHPRHFGRVFVETGYQLTPETVRIPDVSFVTAERMREIDLDKRIQGAPALAIEVVSPTDLAEDLTQKVKQYLGAGAKTVWVFYPKPREVQVLRADGAIFVRRESEILEEPEVLPGFSLDLKSVF
ncbi:MAG: Uma2 family endonuclease [Terriglobia bacterium]|jgi:Uma2 family endonuclease